MKLIYEVDTDTRLPLEQRELDGEILRAIADRIDPLGKCDCGEQLDLQNGSEKVAPAADASVPLGVAATPPPEPSAPAAPSPAREASAPWVNPPFRSSDLRDQVEITLRAECDRLSRIIAERNNQIGDLTETLQKEKEIGRQTLKELDHARDLLKFSAAADFSRMQDEIDQAVKKRNAAEARGDVAIASLGIALGHLLVGRVDAAKRELRESIVKAAEAGRG